jgi:hypothetical protein
MEIRQTRVAQPFFSICIPQYNRTAFLLEACKTLAAQTTQDFEVCIADDCSTDEREDELLAFLQQSSLPFIYQRQAQNRGYDANLRTSIGLARGEFCFLLGNDDALISLTILADLQALLSTCGPVGVAITNYEDFATSKVFRRMHTTGVLGSGAKTAVRYFRDVSFVSGIILATAKAQAHATDCWDGSEMYQMYLMCRIVAEGTPLVGIDQITVRKDTQLPGESVDSYATKRRELPCPIVERPIPLRLMGRLVTTAIAPFQSTEQTHRLAEKAVAQVLLFPYCFWLLEYRRVQSWQYAAGIGLGMRPRHVFLPLGLSWGRRMRLSILYVIVTLIGLCLPLSLFDWLYPLLYRVAKSR